MPLIQLHPHPFTSIPAHPSFPTDSSRPDLHQYISTALHEALELLHSIPSTFTTDPKLRPSPPSQAKVKLLRGWRKPSSEARVSTSASAKGKEKRNSEFWVCRQSEHLDAPANGTALWTEFEAGLRSEHAEHEMEYTPSVSAVDRLLEWAAAAIGEVEVDGVRFQGVSVEGMLSRLNMRMNMSSVVNQDANICTLPVNLITHTFHPSALIAPRSFISLTISAAYNGTPPLAAQEQVQAHEEQSPPRQGFLTVQIPLHPTPSSTPQALHQKITASAPKRAIFANYASIERVELLPASGPASQTATESEQSQAQAPSRIEWTMATTSDAGGSIPQWVQRSWMLGGVPRAVVADVGLFIGWTMRRRGAA